jgi:fucose permease
VSASRGLESAANTSTAAPPGSYGSGERRSGAAGLPAGAFDALVLYSFVVLGLPDGTLGTAWPAVRRGFGTPLGYLGIVLLVGTAGSVLSSTVAGALFGRLGTQLTIMLAGALGALGALGIALSPSFVAFAVAGGLIGMAAGLLDSTVNTSVAMTGRNRLLNMVHGAYGVGTALAPLVVTASVLAGSWRASYAAVVAGEIALVAGWWLAGRRAGYPSRGAPVRPAEALRALDGSGVAREPGVAPGRRRLWLLVGLGLVVFMVYTGFEVSAGQWSPSFERSVLHMSPGATGLATFGYWGSLTLARFGLAVPRRPVAPRSVVRWGCLAALIGAALVWWRPAGVVALLGLVVVGAALAGVFPALVALTPARVGGELAHHVIGWQIGAASVGGSAISALCGFSFQRWGLGELGPALVAAAVALVAMSLLLERAGVR